jgi:hypothetical protein
MIIGHGPWARVWPSTWILALVAISVPNLAVPRACVKVPPEGMTCVMSGKSHTGASTMLPTTRVVAAVAPVASLSSAVVPVFVVSVALRRGARRSREAGPRSFSVTSETVVSVAAAVVGVLVEAARRSVRDAFRSRDVSELTENSARGREVRSEELVEPGSGRVVMECWEQPRGPHEMHRPLHSGGLLQSWMHIWPAPSQRFPHPPQFSGSVSRSTHAPLHSVSPGAQTGVQIPAVHDSSCAHALPHAPQFSGSP